MMKSSLVYVHDKTLFLLFKMKRFTSYVYCYTSARVLEFDTKSDPADHAHGVCFIC